ncbi:MAG: proline--tRNA ligase, partial [Steroidobacteraceae bacterium]|nr:proline--tRNA ligase [Steroidobacteraceae bacterium]
RPRFGVMRGREFTMKDAYSFDRDKAGALASYRLMFDAYKRIFDRFGLQYRAVAADTGAIGGDASHEFQVIADTGEDAIAYCPTSEYAANVELAEALALLPARGAARAPMTKTPTPGRSTCEDVAALLGIALAATVKSLVLASDDKDEHGAVATTTLWLLLVRGDHSLNEVKVGKLPGLTGGFRFASAAEIEQHFGCSAGYLGPVATARPVKVVADRTVANMADFVCGANEADFHLTGVNWGRDLPEPQVADLRNVVAGDPSPSGKGRLSIARGIEVGHIFQLGRKYSDAMKAAVLDEESRSTTLYMGCYGIGVTRVVAAAIEQNHDERGIIWPEPIAPFQVVLVPINFAKSQRVRETADRLYDELTRAGIEVLLDDRDARPGAKFADAELLGIPHRVVVGERGLEAGKLEYRHRRAAASEEFALDDALAFIRSRLAPG